MEEFCKGLNDIRHIRSISESRSTQTQAHPTQPPYNLYFPSSVDHGVTPHLLHFILLIMLPPHLVVFQLMLLLVIIFILGMLLPNLVVFQLMLLLLICILLMKFPNQVVFPTCRPQPHLTRITVLYSFAV